MQDDPNVFDAPMANLGRDAWQAALADIGEEAGFFERLGARHMACFIEEGSTLLVSFESRQGIQTLSDTGQPLGFEMVKAAGCSHLAMVSEGDTWFRDPEVFAFFDHLDDEGFFDDFDHVVFYGAGPCGYAAAAFARAAQDATVVAIQPQATLDPRIANWDERFIDQRLTSFSGPYGYAPEFTDLSSHTFVLFDPRETLDAMHAALFLGPKTTMLRAPFLGGALQSAFLEMSLLYRILARATKGRLSAPWFYKALRARRSHPPYLRNLMAVLERDGRDDLIEIMCENVTARMNAPRFERKIQELRAKA